MICLIGLMRIFRDWFSSIFRGNDRAYVFVNQPRVSLTNSYIYIDQCAGELINMDLYYESGWRTHEIFF